MPQKPRTPVTPVSPMDPLEPRTLLSAGVEPATMWTDWGGLAVPHRAGQFVVTFDGALGDQGARAKASEFAAALGVGLVDFRSIGGGRYGRLTVDGTFSRPLAERAAEAVGGVRGVEPDVIYRTMRAPNDPFYSEQWGLSNTGQTIFGQIGLAGADIDAPLAWDVTIGSRDVVIGIVDTGLNVNHPDLAANIWVNPGEVANNGIDDDGNGYIDDINGYDFGELDNNLFDDGGHGTLVAGTAGAVGNNGTGVAGVAWNVSIMGLKIADRFGDLQLSAIVAATDYATAMLQRGINLAALNASYGGYGPEFYTNAPSGFLSERDAIVRYLDAGGTFIASAGNDGFDNDSTLRAFPASYNLPGLISVGATDNRDQRAIFNPTTGAGSNFGRTTVALAAPGLGILTTTAEGGYALVNGTSFSAPMVTGAVALLKSFRPEMSAPEIRRVLIDSADPIAQFQNLSVSGGRLNVARALQIAGINGPVVRAVNPGPVTGQIDLSTNQPLNAVTVTFNKDLRAADLSPARVTLVGAGPDALFGTGDDRNIGISGVTLTSPSVARIALVLSGLPQQRLPIDNYRLTLQPLGFRDTDGNFLNGNNVGGTPETYNFRVAAFAGENEPNDTFATATPTAFSAEGRSDFTNVRIGNGLFAGLDVDLYRIEMPRGGQITAEVTAQRLATPSGFDGVLRLFNALGQQLAINDQFFNADPYVDFFVSTGGTYYVGVSGAGNNGYDAGVGGSGRAQSLGVYNLRLQTALIASDRLTVSSNLGAEKPIPPVGTQGTTSDFLRVDDSRQVLDVNVRLNIRHTFVGDLDISLIAPGGRQVALATQRGNDGQNFTGTLLDDEASVAVAAGAAPFSGSFRPDGALSGFDGQSALGNWTLLIIDRRAGNTGGLISWALEFTLQNDVFGPFELNDTLPVATNLAGVSGFGAQTITSFLGDGGFGTRDRDLFRFTADEGATLTARAVSGGAADTALRLFDSEGREVRLNSPGGLNSEIGDYVFQSSGVYYLGVSEASNLAYNPLVVSTGSPAATTGAYTLTVSIARGVSDPTFALRGDRVGAGFSTGGTFSTPAVNASTLGLSFNQTEFLWNAARNGGVPDAFFGASANGAGFKNTPDQPALAFTIAEQSDPYNRRAVARGVFNGLEIERVLSYGVGDAFIAVDVFVRNSTSAALSNVAWMEGFNPEQGANLPERLGSDTRNDVDPARRLASARVVTNPFPQGLTVALAAPAIDTRASANVVTDTRTLRDAAALLAVPLNDPNGTASDSSLTMAFNLGTLNAGAQASARYFIFFGSSPAQVDEQVFALNQGTGRGHLAVNPAAPASEPLETNPPGGTAPTLPFRLYYPEGFVGNNISTYVPILNPNSQPATVFVIARWEGSGARDQVIGTLTIGANTRSGLTLLTPELLGGGNAPVNRDATPYAVEIRSDRPVAATFSYYDTSPALTGGRSSSLGEAFTSRVSSTWSFGRVLKGQGNTDFILFYNTSESLTKVTTTLYPKNGGAAPFEFTFDLQPLRRGGLSINAIIADNLGRAVPDGEYAALVSASGGTPIVAALSHYNSVDRVAETSVGTPGAGSSSGVIPEGQVGQGDAREVVSVLNTSVGTPATVNLSFIFTNGSTYRTSVTAPAQSVVTLDVNALPGFNDVGRGQPYSTFFQSNVPVTVNVPTTAFDDQLDTATAERGFSQWAFAEGFRPADGSGHPGVREYLRLFNPGLSQTTVEITMAYDNGVASETFRRTLEPRQVLQLEVDTLVTGFRRGISVWFGINVKSQAPIVAYMAHIDRFFPGAFGTLGTPLGLNAPIV